MIVTIDLHDPGLLNALASCHQVVDAPYLTIEDYEACRTLALRTLAAIQAYAAGHPIARPADQSRLAPGQFLVRSGYDNSSQDTWPY